MIRARPHAIHFKRILDFGEGRGETGNVAPKSAPGLASILLEKSVGDLPPGVDLSFRV